MINESNVTCLFDFDGTISDTQTYYDEYWKKTGATYLPHIEDFHIKARGQALARFINEYFPEELYSTIEEEMKNFDLKIPYDYISGAEEFLKSIKAAGIKTALVTNSEDYKMNYVFKAKPELLVYFDTVVTKNKVEKPKPDPQCYLLAAQELNAKTEDCIVFEDSLIGMEAGRRAGMKVVGLATTNTRDVIQGSCDQIIDNYVGLTIDLVL